MCQWQAPLCYLQQGLHIALEPQLPSHFPSCLPKGLNETKQFQVTTEILSPAPNGAANTVNRHGTFEAMTRTHMLSKLPARSLARYSHYYHHHPHTPSNLTTSRPRRWTFITIRRQVRQRRNGFLSLTEATTMLTSFYCYNLWCNNAPPTTLVTFENHTCTTQPGEAGNQLLLAYAALPSAH